MTNSSALLEIRDITKTYGSETAEVLVLKGISINIYAGEFVAIMGPSGSGKSTLMNIIGCLDKPTTGSYKFQGQDIASLDSNQQALLRCHTFGFIFQRYNLLNTATAQENVTIPAIYAGVSETERQEKGQVLLENFGLGSRLNHFPRQLSGGEQQRVAIARALMNGGRIILADEPTGALDSKSGETVMQYLKELHRKGHTIIVVTHAIDIAAQAERIIELRDGEIVQEKPSVHQKEDPVERLDWKRSEMDWSSFQEAVKMAWRSILAHSYRSLLTMLGIVIGVASVVAMLAIGYGTKTQVLDRIKALGTNLLVIRSGAPGIRGGSATPTLSIEDANAITQLPDVSLSVPEITKQATVRYQTQAYQTAVTGTTDEFPEAHDWQAVQGAFFNKQDFNSYAPVAVIGQTILKNVFPDNPNPVGEFFLIGNVPFLVIGVMESKGASLFGSDQDDAVWVPLTTGRARIFGGQASANQIFVEVSNEEAVNRVEETITLLLLERHKNLDFNVRNMESLLATSEETQNTLTLLLGSIALIALLVGGIGVMNIMLVSVTERTREIGIRMALGARRFDVLFQFLTESIVICSVGGVIGIALGVACAWFAKQFGTPVEFSLFPIVLSFGCSFATGMLFGFLPAKKAADLNPVTALSME